MADLVIAWLSNLGPDSTESYRLLAGKAYLGMRDPLRAIDTVDGIPGEAAERIRASAMLQLGDAKSAAQSLLDSGDATGGARTAVWTRDWSFVKEAGPDAWKQALETLSTPTLTDPTNAAPIARGSQLVEESASARSAIEQLLIDASNESLSQ